MSMFWTCLCSMAIAVGGSRVETTGGSVLPLLLQKVQSLSQHPRSAAAVLPLLTLLQTNSKKWTAGTSDSLKGIDSHLGDIQSSITAASGRVQVELDGLVNDISTTATNTDEGKRVSARGRVNAWVSCVTQEKKDMETIITKQGEYRQKVKEQKEPCDRENSTQFFSQTSSALTVSCNLDATGQQACISGLGSLSSAATSTTGAATTFVQEQVADHVQAEKDCWQAANASATALEAVDQSQEDWGTQRGECENTKRHRNWAICEFGHSLKRVCRKVRAYELLVSQAKGSGTVYSIADRVTEMQTIELVRCYLQHLQDQQADISTDISSCKSDTEDSAAVTALRALDFKADAMEENRWGNPFANGQGETRFYAECSGGDGENLGWHFADKDDVRNYEVPDFSTTHYDGAEPSPEEGVLSQYKPSTVWQTVFHEYADDNYFEECKDTEAPTGKWVHEWQ